MPLNIQTIKAAKCPEGKRSIDLRDGDGLILRVTHKGTKTWRYEYRIGGTGKQRKKTINIGHFPSTSLADARTERDKLKISRSEGIDPSEKRKNDIRENKANEQARSSASTITDLINEYVATLDGKPSQKEIERILNKEVGAIWPDRSAYSVTRQECTKLLNNIKKRAPVRSNRVYSYIKAMFRRGVLSGLIDSSPMVISEKPYQQEKAELDQKKKEKPLSEGEIKTLYNTLTDMSDNPSTRGTDLLYSNILLVQLFTGARPKEVLNMKWEQIENNIWTLGLGEHKTGHSKFREIRRPIITPVQTIINKQNKDSELVFPSPRTGKALSTASLGNWINRVRGEGSNKVKKFGIEGFSAHHLRHTLATLGRKIGIRPDLVERLLGHVTDSSIAETYSAYDWTPELTIALEKWYNWIQTVTNKNELEEPKSNIVNLPPVFR